MIHAEYVPSPPTRRQVVLLMLEMARITLKRASGQCEAHLGEMIASANGLHLITSAKHLRAAWAWWSLAVECARQERDCQDELARMDAS